MVEIFSQLIGLLSLGFVLGLQHALDADHVVAVTTQVSETKSLKKSSLLGALWGLGHTTTLLVTGALVLIFKWSIPDTLALSLEFLVGVLLVILGIDVLRKIRQSKAHIHTHEHEGRVVHDHLHSHKMQTSHNHTHRSFFIGLIHGLAGSAALMLLVLATVASIFEGLLFILFFGVGTILGMLVTSTIIAIPFKFAANINRLNKIIRTCVGVTSIILGFVVMYKTSFI